MIRPMYAPLCVRTRKAESCLLSRETNPLGPWMVHERIAPQVRTQDWSVWGKQ